MPGEEAGKDPSQQPHKPQSSISSIREAVAEQIARSGPEVRGTVIDVMAGKEIERRKQAVVKGLELIGQMHRDYNKMKPDVVTYDAEGKVQSEGYSKKLLDDRKKAKEKIDKLTKALETALAPEKPDYQKLFEVVGASKGGGGEAEEASEG